MFFSRDLSAKKYSTSARSTYNRRIVRMYIWWSCIISNVLKTTWALQQYTVSTFSDYIIIIIIIIITLYCRTTARDRRRYMVAKQ